MNNNYSFQTCKNDTYGYRLVLHIWGSKLTAARRMKQKLPFPKEKGDTTKSDLKAETVQ